MEQLVNFTGRFHPLLVHLPIGSIIVAFLFDALSLTKSYRRLGIAVQPALVFGAVAALFSVVTGLCLAEEGGYDTDVLTYHQYSGIVTTFFAFALILLRRQRWILRYERNVRKPVRFFLFIPLIIALTLAGHFGGSLTHGEEFLTGLSFSQSEEKVDPIQKLQSIKEPNEAVLYQDVIQPILESKCYSCHSASKQKGDLRLDSPESILKGGKDGKVIESGIADSSSLFARMMLPLEHDDHMPPNEKPQPGSVELDIIRLWINEGARFDVKLKDLHDPNHALQFVNLLMEGAKKDSWLPKEETSPPDEDALAKLRATGAVVLPVGENSNYVQVSFSNVKSVTEESIHLLRAVSDQLVSLRLSYCALEKNDLAFLNGFSHLTWLYLDHTNVNDSSFQSVKTIQNLKYLNIVFTPVSDQPITKEKFPQLEQVFAFQTNIQGAAFKQLHEHYPSLTIDTGGVSLPKIASDTIIYRKKS